MKLPGDITPVQAVSFVMLMVIVGFVTYFTIFAGRHLAELLKHQQDMEARILIAGKINNEKLEEILAHQKNCP
jgi:hypothetical protein